MGKRAWLLLAGVGMMVSGCATPQVSRPEVADAVVAVERGLEVSQEDLEEVETERIAGFWGDPGYLIRIGSDEFVVHRPQDGRVMARKKVEDRLHSASISPEGDFVCVLHGAGEYGARLSLYEVESGEWRWQKPLSASGYMVIAGVDKCLVGYLGGENPEVYEAEDGKVRVRLIETPPEPMGVFTSPDGYRQWWVSPVDELVLEEGESPGTRWEVTQVEIRSWTYEGRALARCVEADEGQLRAVGHEASDGDAFAEMARRAQMGFGRDGCEPAGPQERMRFADGEHRLERTMISEGVEEEVSEGESSEEEVSEEEVARTEEREREERQEGDRPRIAIPSEEGEGRGARTRRGEAEDEEAESAEEIKRRGESVIRRGQREIRRLPNRLRSGR